MLLGIGAYTYAALSAHRKIQQVKKCTVKAVVEVQGVVDTGTKKTIGITKTIEITSKEDIAALFDVLKLERNPVFLSRGCECTGNPHIKLYDTKGCFATITIHHGKSIRCTLWKSCNVNIRKEVIPKFKDYFNSIGVDVDDSLDLSLIKNNLN